MTEKDEAKSEDKSTDQHEPSEEDESYEQSAHSRFQDTFDGDLQSFMIGRPLTPLEKMRKDFLAIAAVAFDAGSRASELDRAVELAQASTDPKARICVLGFDSTTIPPGKTDYITKRPQVIFRPSHLTVPDAIAPDLVLVDIKVGNNSQFVASGEVPATAFSDKAVQGHILKLDVCQIAMNVTLVVRNTSDHDVVFSACMSGPAIE